MLVEGLAVPHLNRPEGWVVKIGTAEACTPARIEHKTIKVTPPGCDEPIELLAKVKVYDDRAFDQAREEIRRRMPRWRTNYS